MCGLPGARIAATFSDSSPALGAGYRCGCRLLYCTRGYISKIYGNLGSTIFSDVFSRSLKIRGRTYTFLQVQLKIGSGKRCNFKILEVVCTWVAVRGGTSSFWRFPWRLIPGKDFRILRCFSKAGRCEWCTFKFLKISARLARVKRHASSFWR